MYKLTDVFLRLTPVSFANGFVAGVGPGSDVRVMAACDNWLIATSSDEWVKR
jgi:hypothetical protein